MVNFFQNAPCGLLTIWTDGRIIEANQTLLNWLGYDRSDVVSVKSFQDFLNIGGRMFFETHLLPLLQMKGEVAEINMELKGNGSKTLPSLLNLKKMMSQELASPVFCISVTNVKQRILYEQELLSAKKKAEIEAKKLGELNKELDRFANSASETLLNPVSAITDMLSILKIKNLLKPNMQADEIFSVMKDNSDRMRQMLLDFKEYLSIIDKGPNSETVDLNEVFDLALKEATGKNQSKISLFKDDLPKVNGVKSQLQILFKHLISNAVIYRSFAVPVISVSFEEKGDYYVIKIKDNGMGIEQEDYLVIFDFMHRLHAYKDIPGTGIGLATSKRIVDNHVGKIWVNSAVGNGSTFCFTLPKG
ncbi:PAS domain-containing sensor histidine kinase [Litoribacter ruber]|uniref:ATP-binding protein n=1 Tax=Litoribacter ruber TaxID=702568 RepID=UPI001BD99458|nr:ATP-binding protein [Litoribacter ruber]MBT0811520.1 PAS domain-containing sensor histidine kinase [Litoribacter ruber]